MEKKEDAQTENASSVYYIWIIYVGRLRESLAYSTHSGLLQILVFK